MHGGGSELSLFPVGDGRRQLLRGTTHILAIIALTLFTLFVKVPVGFIDLCAVLPPNDMGTEDVLVLVVLQIVCNVFATFFMALIWRDVRKQGSEWTKPASVRQYLSKRLSLLLTLSGALSLVAKARLIYLRSTGGEILVAFDVMVVTSTPLLLSIFFNGLPLEFLSGLCSIVVAALAVIGVWTQHSSVIYVALLFVAQAVLVLTCVRHATNNIQMVARIDKRHLGEALQVQEMDMKHMMANVAHDLKTPLSSFMTGIDIVAEMLVECCDSLESGAVDVAMITKTLHTTASCLSNVRNTNSFMLMTINRVMDYTKACKGMKLVPKYETICLEDTLRLPLTCMKDIQNRINIVLTPVSASICTHIITDKQWLQENLLCLLSNAVKYSNSGTITLTATVLRPETVSCATSNNVAIKEIFSSSRVSPDALSTIRFEIEDEGIGMSDEDRASLFSAFKQNQRLAGGTGLGLFSLAKRIAAMKGQCGVDPRRDGRQGSLFWFSFPYRPDPSAAGLLACSESRRVLRLPGDHLQSGEDAMFDLQQSARMRSVILHPAYQTVSTSEVGAQGLLVENSRSHMTMLPHELPSILLVDDAPSVTKMTAMMLRRHGFQVEIADNGANALEWIEAQLTLLAAADGDNLAKKPAFDFILMDLQMPIMDGLEATRRLREWEQALATPNKVTLAPVLRHKIIGVSANCDDDVVQDTKDAGFDGFISKPFAMATFHDVLKRIEGK